MKTQAVRCSRSIVFVSLLIVVYVTIVRIVNSSVVMCLYYNILLQELHDRLFFAHPYPTVTNRHTEQPIYLWSPLEGIVADSCYINDFSSIRMYWV